VSGIADLRGLRVWDSRGNPTVEAVVVTARGAVGRAIAPAGASRGRREAVDLRDGGTRLRGMDVARAVAHVGGPIRERVRGMEVADQAAVDAALVALDGTADRGRLGGNALVAVSLAVMQAAATEAGVPVWRHLAALHGAEPTLPLPEIQIFGGGAHAERRVDVQDFMVMVPGAGSFAEALEVTAEVYHAAGAIMRRRGLIAGVADEGGWWPMFRSNEEALETLCEAIIAAGETPGGRVVVSLDIAASEFGEAGVYRLALDGSEMGAAAWGEVLARWIADYAVVSVEDPMGEDDLAGFAAFTAAMGGRVQIVGDDLLVTRAALVEVAAGAGAGNAVLLKPNQVGTVSETVAALNAARRHGWGAVVSARSGETEDVAIVHLATGLDAGQLKVGSFARSERMAKWNEGLRIEAELPGQFAGARPLALTWWGNGAGPGGAV
jgi:enolase